MLGLGLVEDNDVHKYYNYDMREDGGGTSHGVRGGGGSGRLIQ